MQLSHRKVACGSISKPLTPAPTLPPLLQKYNKKTIKRLKRPKRPIEKAYCFYDKYI